MAGKIFINYRKEDSNWNSLALYNELKRYFPPDMLFKDFNTIEPGDDFEVSIQNALKSCEVLLVIIGREWLTIKDSRGNQRIFDPNDFVCLEIASALEGQKRIIPVLFDNVQMPLAEQLPNSLKLICRRQYYEISKERFEYDVKVLAEYIIKTTKSQIIIPQTNPPGQHIESIKENPIELKESVSAIRKQIDSSSSKKYQMNSWSDIFKVNWKLYLILLVLAYLILFGSVMIENLK